jgi:hypothetical protein
MSADFTALTKFGWPGTWSPASDSPIVIDTEIRGSLQSISGAAGDRLTDIKGQRLAEGMLVYVKTGYTAGAVTRAGDSYYKYSLLSGEVRNPSTGGLPNAEANWTLAEFGAGGSSGGEAGSTGATGSAGIDGATGATGERGLDGATGATGERGFDGATGATGAKGETGSSGVSDRYETVSYSTINVDSGQKTIVTFDKNLNYSTKQTILVANRSNSGATYLIGDVVSYDKPSGTLVFDVKNHQGSGDVTPLLGWAINLNGAIGVIGATGVGATGPIGIDGATGATGDKGETGATGLSGGYGLFNSGATGFVYSVEVGGAAPLQVTDWETKTINEVLDTILFPTLQPEYIVPTIGLTGPSALSFLGYVEVASPINKAFTASAVKNDAGAFTRLDLIRIDGATGAIIKDTFTSAGATDMPDSFGISGNNNNPNLEYSLSHTDNGTAVAGTITWKAKATYNQGEYKQTNKGVTDSRTRQVRLTTAAQAGSDSLESNTFTAKAVYPVFYGTSASSITSTGVVAALNAASKVLVDPSDTITINFTAPINESGKYLWFAVHESYPVKKIWYNTPVNNGKIGSGELFLSPDTQNVSSVTGSNWTNKNYKIYISSIATVTEGSFEFRNE